LPHTSILLISTYGYFLRINKGGARHGCRFLASVAAPEFRLERNENFISRALPQASAADYTVWPKSVAAEHFGNAFFY
jgi:hypothetical protein